MTNWKTTLFGLLAAVNTVLMSSNLYSHEIGNAANGILASLMGIFAADSSNVQGGQK